MLLAPLGAVIWVRGQVVKELDHGNIGGFSGCGLLRAQGAEGGKEFVVNKKKCVWPWFQSQKAIFLSERRKHKVMHLFNGNFGDFCETFSLGQLQR
jgi:hypothetical protein